LTDRYVGWPQGKASNAGLHPPGHRRPTHSRQQVAICATARLTGGPAARPGRFAPHPSGIMIAAWLHLLAKEKYASILNSIKAYCAEMGLIPMLFAPGGDVARPGRKIGDDGVIALPGGKRTLSFRYLAPIFTEADARFLSAAREHSLLCIDAIQLCGRGKEAVLSDPGNLHAGAGREFAATWRLIKKGAENPLPRGEPHTPRIFSEF